MQQQTTIFKLKQSVLAPARCFGQSVSFSHTLSHSLQTREGRAHLAKPSAELASAKTHKKTSVLRMGQAGISGYKRGFCHGGNDLRCCAHAHRPQDDVHVLLKSRDSTHFCWIDAATSASSQERIIGFVRERRTKRDLEGDMSRCQTNPAEAAAGPSSLARNSRQCGSCPPAEV
jgi:hypothetical protein